MATDAADILAKHIVACPYALENTVYNVCPADVHGIRLDDAERCGACLARQAASLGSTE